MAMRLPFGEICLPPANKFDNDNLQDNIAYNSLFGQEASLVSSPVVWTWDWHLPKLTSLELGYKFALQFRFQ
ncbi:hypothetical protein BG011_006232, partial [Mortierella polycephala]